MSQEYPGCEWTTSQNSTSYQSERLQPAKMGCAARDLPHGAPLADKIFRTRASAREWRDYKFGFSGSYSFDFDTDLALAPARPSTD
jgi:hypothetical protein